MYAQYRPLVAGWVAGHPDLSSVGCDTDDLANRAFERMWAALTPAKFRGFSDLRAVLAYLKMCAHSAVMEEARRAGPRSRTVSFSDLPEEVVDAQPDRRSTEREILEREKSQGAPATGERATRDERERAVIHGLFVLDLKPAAIHAQHPDLFGDIREVYLVRQVVLERLSRDAKLPRFVRRQCLKKRVRRVHGSGE